jgi:hypothetical protein
MATSGYWYSACLLNAFGGSGLSEFPSNIDYLSDTIKVMLVDSSYTPSQDTHRVKASVTPEVTGSGYTAGGEVLTSKTLSYIASANIIAFKADDITWPSSNITARYAVIYKLVGSDVFNPLLGYIDFGANITSTNADFQLAWNAAGFLRITVN